MAERFKFGIYAGSVSGTPQGFTSGPTDDLAATLAALRELQGETEQMLIVRAYLHFKGASAFEQFGLRGGSDLYSQKFDSLISGNRLDLVLCFHDPEGNITTWKEAIRQAIAKYGMQLARLQITEEANLRFGTGAIDGDYPNVMEALVEGTAFARAALDQSGFTAVPVGFSVGPALFGPGANSFWADLKAAATPQFLSSVGYVGADFFPDVFHPVALEQIPESVAFLLQHFRDSMTSAGIDPNTPLIVTENGWPTGSGRSEARQAQTMLSIVQTVYSRRAEFKVHGYTWFALRDADSASNDIFHSFGLLRSDYSKKTAFQTFKDCLQGDQYP